MKLVKVTGPLDQLNNFISTCCLDGSFHPEQATQYMSASMGYSTLSEENPYAPMLQKIEELIRENDSAPDPTIVGDRSREIQLDDKTSAYIDELDEKLSAMHDEYKELEDQLEQCRNGIAKYEHFTGFDVGLDELFNCKFIKTRFGHMPKESYEKLVAYDDDPYVLFIPCSTDATDYWGVYCAPRERVDEVDSIFAGLNFERLQVPSAVGTVEQVIDQLKSNIEIIEGDLKQLDERAAALWKENRKRCNEIYTKLVDLNTVFEMRRYAACHNKYFFYVGWVLAHDSKAFEKKAEAIENVEVEENDPDNSSGKTPPVKLRNPAIFKPYEYFVDMYGLPSYSDIDVTGFVAITYTLLFGIMFGDLGQGLVLFLLGILGGLMPVVFLNTTIQRRQKQIEHQLPEVLDLLCVSVQAGLSFDAALSKITARMKGPFIDECRRMQDDIRMGVVRRTAMRSMADRCGLEDVSLFMTSIIQAERLGTSMGKTLKNQADNIRERRRQYVKAQAMKAPVKIVFPLVLFIFPAIFVVTLVPSLLYLLKNL